MPTQNVLIFHGTHRKMLHINCVWLWLLSYLLLDCTRIICCTNEYTRILFILSQCKWICLKCTFAMDIVLKGIFTPFTNFCQKQIHFRTISALFACHVCLHYQGTKQRSQNVKEKKKLNFISKYGLEKTWSVRSSKPKKSKYSSVMLEKDSN